MRTDLDSLLVKLADRYAAGADLDVEGLLREAGPAADELAVLIDRFLERSPRGVLRETNLAYVRTLDEPPLLAARIARRVPRANVIKLLMADLGIAGASRDRVERRYHELESGLLDAERVSAKVWSVLAGALGEGAVKLARVWQPPALEGAYLREASSPASVMPQLLSPPPESREEDAEVDRLFGAS